jgi:peroxiredoxin
VTLIGVTEASVVQADEYRVRQGLAFPILADAAATHDTWGVELIWGNVVRLVDPQGQVVAESLDEAARVLAAR